MEAVTARAYGDAFFPISNANKTTAINKLISFIDCDCRVLIEHPN